MIDTVRKLGGRASSNMDIHLKELLSKGAVAFGYRMIGIGLVFVLQIVMARKLGAFEFGLYSICITLTMLLSSISRLGLDLAVVRKIAEAISMGRPGYARAWLTKSLLVVLFAGGLVAALVFLCSDLIAEVLYSEPKLATPLAMFSVAIPATALMIIVAESLKGLKDVASAALSQSILVPLILLAILSSVSAQVDVRDIALLYSAATLIAFAFGYFKWVSSIHNHENCPIELISVVRFSWPFFLANIGSMLLTWSDTLIVGIFANAEDVARYYAASKLATVTSFILIAINAISAPKFTAMHASGDSIGLARLAKQSTAVMIILALVPTALLISFPSLWLGLFGMGFEQAAYSLLALTAGQTINVACGSVGLLLAMTGNEKTMSKIFLITAALTICASTLSGMQWGANGVATTTAIGMATWNIWMLIAVRKRLGFWTFPTLPAHGSQPS